MPAGSSRSPDPVVRGVAIRSTSPTAGSARTGLAPTPCTGTEATGDRTFPVDVGDHFTVTGQQRFGRTHLGAKRQLAFGQTVPPALGELGLRVVFFRPTGAEGAAVTSTDRGLRAYFASSMKS